MPTAMEQMQKFPIAVKTYKTGEGGKLGLDSVYFKKISKWILNYNIAVLFPAVFVMKDCPTK